MNLGQIVQKIQLGLKDPAILRETIIEEINRKQTAALAMVCNPDLITTDTVTVAEGDLSVAMPDDYHHDLLSVFSTTNESEVEIRTNTKALYDGYLFPDTGDAIEECAVEGGILHVRPMAAADEALFIRYYGKPLVLVGDGDIPTSIPEHLHPRILVSGTIAELLPSAAMEPQIKLTLIQTHIALERVGLESIRAFYPYRPRSTPKPRRKINWF